MEITKISKTLAIGAMFAFALTSAATAATITGTPSANPSPGSDVFNSTNALNYAMMTPGREGQLAPYVLLNSTGMGSVTLDFFNPAAGLAYFEFRIDGITTGSTAHPVVTGDTIHSTGNAVASGATEIGMTYFANNTFEVRLALGGERDWDFDWTSFDVGPVAAVPLPAGLPLLLGALGAFGLVSKRRKKA